LSDPDEALSPGAELTPTGRARCEEALDIELYQARASHWREVAAVASDMTLYAAFTEVARAYERLAFVASQPAKAAIHKPKRRPRASV
jgi:hypothetical protein